MSDSILQKKYFKLFDGIRGFSILAVVWHHSAGKLPINLEILNHGYLGVHMFFILSGFLITFLLLKELDLHKTISLKKFYIRRSLRIFPLYYTYLGLLTIWTILSESSVTSDTLKNLPYYFFYISNFIPETQPGQYFERSWSLSVEEQFYLFWPMLFLTLNAYRSAIATILLISTITVLDLLHFGPRFDAAISLLIPFRAILFGCLLALLLSKPKLYTFVSSWLLHKHTMLAFCLLLIYQVYISGQAITGIEYFLVHLLMVIIISCSVINESNSLSSVLGWKPLQLCGVISYGIYVLHSQFWGITRKIVEFIPIEAIAESQVTFFLVFLFTSFIAALLSYNLFESHFLKLKAKFST